MIPLPGNVQREIGRRIRSLRLREGWTQEELGERAGVASTTVLRLESGGSIGLSRLLRIATVLGVLDTFAEVARIPPEEERIDDLRELTRQRGRRRAKRAPGS